GGCRERSGKVWEAFAARDRRSFGQRMRRLWEWAASNVKGAWLLEQVEKFCKRKEEYGRAYDHPGGHRTSNMLDRVMRGMNRYFEDCQHLHGSAARCGGHCRPWALLHTFGPGHEARAWANQGWRGPAERLNEHRYHDHWLQNLFGLRFPRRLPPPKPPAPQSVTVGKNAVGAPPL